MSSMVNANPGITIAKSGNPATKWDVKEIIPIQVEVFELKFFFDTITLGPIGMVNIFGSHLSQFQIHLFAQKQLDWCIKSRSRR